MRAKIIIGGADYFFLGGTLSPFFLASLIPIAIICLGEVTTGPFLLPECNSPLSNFLTTFLIVFSAFLEYFVFAFIGISLSSSVLINGRIGVSSSLFFCSREIHLTIIRTKTTNKYMIVMATRKYLTMSPLPFLSL